MARRTRVIGGAAATAFLVAGLGLFPAAALADSPPGSLTFRAEPAPASGGEAGTWTLEARFTDAADNPLSGQTVEFLLGVDFLGLHQVVVASAVTDASGTATTAYRPTSSARQSLVARASGAGTTSAPVDLGVTAVPQVLAPTDQLGLVSSLAGGGAIGLALVVWALLAGALLSVLRVIAWPRRRGWPEATHRAGQAVGELLE